VVWRLFDDANDFVAHHHSRLATATLAREAVHIATTDTNSLNLDEDLVVLKGRHRQLLDNVLHRTVPHHL